MASSLKRQNSSNSNKLIRDVTTAKVEYEIENRKTIEKFMLSRKDSTAHFLRKRDLIMAQLRQSLSQVDLDKMFLEVFCLLFPTTMERENPDSKSLMEFLQKIFFLDAATYSKLIKKAQSHKLAGHRILHVEVVEGRNLMAMDADGLSDPFCTLYLTSKDSSKRSKVINKTLQPHWEETFKFKVKTPQKDFLCLEVWDYDPEKRFKDKLKTVSEINSRRGIYSFFRDLRHGHDSTQQFMGKVVIQLNDIMSEMTEKWWPLGNTKSDGEIYLRMGLGVNKDRTDAVKCYRALLQLIIMHELNMTHEMVPFHWEMKHMTEAWSEYLLRRLRSGWGVGSKELLLAKFQAFVKVHSIFPLHPRIFPPLVFEVFESCVNSDFNAIDVLTILKSAKELVAFSAEFVERLHEFFTCSMTTFQLYYVLKTLEVLGKQVDKLRSSCDNRTTLGTDLTSISIENDIDNAIRAGARSKFSSLLDTLSNKCSSLEDEAKQAKQFLQVGQLIIDDLEKGLGAVEKDFKQILGLEYHRVTYEIYDIELERIMKPFVTKYCECLQSFRDKCKATPTPEIHQVNIADSDQSTAAATFLHLYLCLKKFSGFVPVLPDDGGVWSGETTHWRVKSSYYLWFSPGILHLLYLMSQIWLNWMRRAIKADYECLDLDDEEKNVMPHPKYNNKTITSSAVDSVEIFTQIQAFWTTLNWPDEHQSVIFAKKLFKKLCGFSMFFAAMTFEQLKRVEKDLASEGYKITPRVCRSINNIHFVGEYTNEIAKLLKLDEILSHVSSAPGFMEQQLTIHQSGLKGIYSNILNSAVSKMERWLKLHINATIKACDERKTKIFEDKIGELMNYLDENLSTLDKHILDSFFDRFISVLWESILYILIKITSDKVKEGRTWEQFTGVKTFLEIFTDYLEAAILHHSTPEEGVKTDIKNSAIFVELKEQMEMYSVPVAELKLKYFDRRHAHQLLKGGDRGYLSVRAMYQIDKNSLFVEILNGSKLLPADSNGQSDPYVEIHLVPRETFHGISIICTTVKKATLFPIFDEHFNIKVSSELFCSEGYIRFDVYDQDYLKKNEFLGETYLPISKIEKSKSSGVKNLTNSVLSLSAPSTEDVDYLKTLVANRVERELKRFLDMENEKLIVPKP